MIMRVYLNYVIFFFQAEDGIRDLTVTGVQTCALPIYVTVLNDPGNTITAVTVALGPENPGGSLCGTTTTGVAGHIAPFTFGGDFGVPPPGGAASLEGGCTHTPTATAGGATAGRGSRVHTQGAQPGE